jgi:hypothetical protein
MKVARVTVIAITQGLARGFQVSWNESVAAAAKEDGPFLGIGRMEFFALSTE